MVITKQDFSSELPSFYHSFEMLIPQMTPKGSISVTKNNKPAGRLTCVSYRCFLSLSLKCECLCHVSLVFVIIVWPIVACHF